EPTSGKPTGQKCRNGGNPGTNHPTTSSASRRRSTGSSGTSPGSPAERSKTASAEATPNGPKSETSSPTAFTTAPSSSPANLSRKATEPSAERSLGPSTPTALQKSNSTRETPMNELESPRNQVRYQVARNPRSEHVSNLNRPDS